MTNIIKQPLKIALTLILVSGLAACNKDNVIIVDDPDMPDVSETPPLPALTGDIDKVFAPMSYFYRSTTRYTYAGRKIVIGTKIEGDDYRWTVDGQPAAGEGRYFSFTPTAAGEYTIGVAVDGDIEGEVKVVCVEGNEADNFREGSSDRAIVYEYVPAPGQFINENMASMTADEAARWATKRLAAGEFVSLGGFGGYVIVGFGHSIGDFTVEGNAYTNSGGASNEPGIVYVMQDVNGNGLPDDGWYELRGSETGKESTVSDYAVTYTRPYDDGSPVAWTDCFGNAGTIDYLAAIHKQPSYYPSWIDADNYTLSGTCVSIQSHVSDAGQWINPPLESGYVDNTGDNGNRFYLSDAMYADYSDADLQYIDFIKIQTGVNGKCGILGELSTEVCKVTLK